MATSIAQIFHILLRHYGPLHWWPAETPFEVCIGAILTQNTNWSNVEKAIGNMRRESLLSPDALHYVPEATLAEIIKPSGCYNIKGARLKSFVTWLFERYDGSLENMFNGNWRELRDELLMVRGIGRETCDSILLYAGYKPSFVVDAYTRRLYSRLGLISNKATYEGIRMLFINNLPNDAGLFNEYHALIVHHGKEHCRKKPRCSGCALHHLCKYPDQVPSISFGPV